MNTATVQQETVMESLGSVNLQDVKTGGFLQHAPNT